jgi:type II secretory pathway component GspD/PulD (secretin)
MLKRAHRGVLLYAIQFGPVQADKLASCYLINLDALMPPPAEIIPMSLRTLLASVLLACSFTAVAATEVIPLNYRTSDDVIPAVKSFLGNEGSVNAYGNKLIVNAEPGKIDELRNFLAQLDTAPRRLLISVDTSDNSIQSDQGYSVNGTVRSQNGNVSANGQTRIINYGTASRDGGVQQVQANEGTPALIQVGQSVPITDVQTDSYGYAQTNTQYRNVTRGFYVTASVTGDIVHLSISTNNDRMSQQRADAIKVQSTDTQVSGRLGEWITLAGVSDQSRADEQGIARRYSTQGRDDMTLRVKVDSLD